jgi:ATP-dependent RNA helicase RhlE
MQSSGLSFYHLGIAPKMLQILERMKFVAPTPIQHKAIPIALEGKDLMGIAQTGTGKTLAFGIPIVQRLSASGGSALVLVPTRELALQVDEAIRKILHPFSLTSIVLIGGAPISNQIKGLRKKPDILVATPGRLIDHLEQKTANLNEVNVLVLDEADRMFDMGFAPQLNQILRRLPRKRQTMLFSATIPNDIINLATQHMKLPINVEIAPSGTAAEKVSQELFIVKQETKKAVLRMLLEKYHGAILIFIRTKRGTKKVTQMIREMGHNVTEIHSDRTMGQRKQAILGFKTGRYRVLAATDVAARGIDVSGIELVINYDLPDDIENYVHRIGRTGRAGEAGHAISFAAPDQGGEVEKIERLIRKTLPRGKHPEFPQHPFTHQTQQFAPRSYRGRGRQSRFSSHKRKHR